MTILGRECLTKLRGNSYLADSIWSHTPSSRCISSTARLQLSKDAQKSPTIELKGKQYRTDSWTNIPESITSQLHRQLHQYPAHPIGRTRQLIESYFHPKLYTHYHDLSPIVTVRQNFDSLGFPVDHPGRSKTDTYYINADTVLRTHTSAHQVDIFRKNASAGYTITADVYRRDAIDRSHYPIFHQMEGARVWDRRKVEDEDLVREVRGELEDLDEHDLEVEDPNPTVHEERNPLQTPYHSIEEVEAIAAHLKKSLEDIVADILFKASVASLNAGHKNPHAGEPLRVRWVEAYFPFTSPSWELEVFWNGDWLELLGCGIVKQNLLISAGVPDQIGWAFGLGLERVAMLLFGIPDIRLFWSEDPRFSDQFKSATKIKRFIPFSIHPACYKDVSFWLNSSSNSAGGRIENKASDFHENDFMEIVRSVGGKCIEDVKLVDSFTHPTSGRRSLCYRINYSSLERTLTNDETNDMHKRVMEKMVEKLCVEMR